jgi:hypothetical protein
MLTCSWSGSTRPSALHPRGHSPIDPPIKPQGVSAVEPDVESPDGPAVEPMTDSLVKPTVELRDECMIHQPGHPQVQPQDESTNKPTGEPGADSSGDPLAESPAQLGVEPAVELQIEPAFESWNAIFCAGFSACARRAQTEMKLDLRCAVVEKGYDESRQTRSGRRPRPALGRDRTGYVGQVAEARNRSSRLAGQELADCLSERRTDDAAVGDETGDETGRSDVKGRVEDRHAIGRSPAPGKSAHLFPIPFFHDNPATLWRRKVKRRGRPQASPC